MTDTANWRYRIRLTLPAYFLAWADNQMSDRFVILLDYGRWIVSACILLLVGVGAWVYWSLPHQAITERQEAALLEWPEIPLIPALNWDVFHRVGNAPAPVSGSLSKQFRLAGTFFTFTGSASAEEGSRRAIVDSIGNPGQQVVSEGDKLGGGMVTQIQRDSLDVRFPDGRKDRLFLSFAGKAAGIAGTAEQGASADESAAETVLSSNRYGKQVETDRWVLSREALMEYYQEMLDDPERLAAIYVSLKPDYNEKDRITGYVLDVEGEGDFFGAVGLKEGDVIRKVNSMRMISQNRAEYFLGQFAQDKLNAVVLDIERNKKSQKLVYMIR